MPPTSVNQSLLRALDLLDELASAPEGTSATVLAERTGLPRPTVARLLATLAERAWVARRGRLWALGPAATRLGRAAPIDVESLSRTVLEEIARTTGESTLIAVPVSPRVATVVGQVDAPTLVGLSDWRGRVFAIHASSYGRLLMAELDDVTVEAELRAAGTPALTPRTRTRIPEILEAVRTARAQGWAEIEDEVELGLSGITVPVHADGKLVALLGIAGPGRRLDAAARREALPKLLAGASQIAALISA